MAKEKSTVELRDERSQLVSQKNGLVNTAKSEKRTLSAEETTQLGTIATRMVDIDSELAELEARNKQNPAQTQTKKTFSLRKAILAQVEGRAFDEDTLAVIERGRESMRRNGQEMRGQIFIPVTEQRAPMVAGTEAQGGQNIDTDHMDLLMPLRDRLVLAQAGATVLTGLVGNIDFPAYSGSNVSWEGENSEAKDGAGTFSKSLMKPKRLTGYIDISKQLLVQDSIGVEAMLRQDLVNALATKLESTIFGSHAKSAAMPDGFFSTLPAAGGVMDWDKIVGMETNIDVSNALAGNLAYVMHPSLFGKAKTTVKKSAGALGFIAENDGSINGYKVLRTNAMSKGLQTAKDEYGILFGNWADFIIGQWGAIDLTVDPYTQSTKAMIRIVVNAYFDAGTRRTASFSTSTMK